MRKQWYSILEMLNFPLKVLFVAIVVYGLGNLFVAQSYDALYKVNNELLVLGAEAIMRVASFIIVNFPLLFLLRLVSKRTNGIINVLNGLAGYAAFLIFTIYFSTKTLPSYAYSATLGISVSSSSAFAGTRYPIQTGIIGIILVTACTRLSSSQTRNRLSNGFLSFIDKDVLALLLNVIYCSICGVGIAIGWPYLMEFYTSIMSFISKDITNPANLFFYGVIERMMCVLNLGSLVRTPFWYQASGGSVMNLVGESVIGDVNMWTATIRNGVLSLQSGKFITPFYVLNIFAVPGLLLAIYTTFTDKIKRGQLRMFFVIAIVVSMLTGCLVPVEIVLLLLCPLLFVFHITYTGFLFGLFQAMSVYLGYASTGTSVITATPGTLLEYISYFNLSNLRGSCFVVLIVGIISFITYFVVTKLYFEYLALDMFGTGKDKWMAKELVEAVGGTSNIKMIHSSCTNITMQLFDPTLLNTNRVIRMDCVKILETRAGFIFDFGAGSRIISKAVKKELRKAIR